MNKRKFKAAMILHGDNGGTVAEALNVSPQTVSAKLNNKAEFTQNEMRILKDRWNLSADEVDEIFFAVNESCED